MPVSWTFSNYLFESFLGYEGGFIVFKKILLSIHTQSLNQFYLQNLCKNKFELWFQIHDCKYEIAGFCRFASKKCKTPVGQQICWNQYFKLKSLFKKLVFLLTHRIFICCCKLILVPECSCLLFVVSCFIDQSFVKTMWFLFISAQENDRNCKS